MVIKFKILYFTLLAYAVLVSLSACSSSLVDDSPYNFPEIIYGEPDYDNPDYEVFHPTAAIENIVIKPANDCEKEKLRRYVITINMYSVEYFNQSYYVNPASEGAQILLEYFPELNKLIKTNGENSSSTDRNSGRKEVVSINEISHILRGLETNCTKN